MPGLVRRLVSWVRRRPKLGRALVAQSYLRGDGIEIGALHRRLRLAPGTRVRYVDRLSRDELYREYPTLAEHDLVPVHVVDDGERLDKFADDSLDFVVANHFLEHCEDPIGALSNFWRVLKSGGVLYLTVPDKRYTFDRDRPVTPLAHVREDHEHGPARSRREHYREWAALVLKEVGEDVIAFRACELAASGFSIHFHVWTQRELMELLLYLRERVAFEIELFLKRGYEVIVVLRKGEPAPRELTRDAAPTHLPGF